ncbi:MAG: InlB B-repeat-containing protein, partial [Firmicutes bacterium]|nr:InlB B-repeat-containing protein [Bacillota bacterium]
MFIKKTSAITAPFLLFLLALLLFLPLEVFAEDQPIANIPTVVEGRVLSSVKAGDSSDWIEIAREGSFSLILRKEALPLGGVLFDSSNPYYPTSSARYQVNSWFNNTLAASAGLRNFTVANTSLAQLGYFTNANLGFSRPNGIAARNGDDVAFLLNFAEAASFCSIQYFEGINYIQSNAAATRNYNKLSSGVNSNAWWLRTTGSGTESPGLFACTVGYDGAVYQTDKTSSVPLLRPALWVDSGIFSENVSYTNTSANTNNYDESANNIPVAPIIVAPPVEQEVFYTLAYNGNGGKGVPPTQEVLGNTNIPVSSIIPINEEFPFLGWANSSNATTAEYQPGDSIFLTNNTTLYAVWDTQIAPIFIALPAEGVVNGRTLTAYRAGDSSDWVEVAQNGGYSLIVRKDCLMNLGRVTFADVETSSYRISHVRDLVNYWFKNTLSSSANLRDFTMQNTALENLGDFTVMTYGLSQPTSVAARTGDDVAFLLSFAEAASYCSLQYANPGGTSFTVSSTIAKNNYYRLNKPGEGIMNDFWWLRSPGHNSNGVATACSVGTHGGIISEGSVYTSSSRAAYPYVRPALWVDSGIFEDNTFTLSYDANGGVGAPPPQTAPANSYLTISTIV